MSRRLVLLGALLLAMSGARSVAQGDPGDGVGPAPTEARAVISRAIAAMGGRLALATVSVVSMDVQAKPGELSERHILRIDGRYLHYTSRRPDGTGFDVVLAQKLAFLYDRDKEGRATYVEDLSPQDAADGAYERDVLFMPFLLPILLERDARMDCRGRNSEGGEVVRALVPPPPNSLAKPFVIRLLFDKKTHLLLSAMGIVPCGHDKGKKRYCDFRDYRPTGPHRILLPRTLRDKRGKDDHPRTFHVRWELNLKVSPTLWLKPVVEKPKGS